MPTMVNPRSLALDNANPRLLSAPNTDILIGQSAELFKVGISGNPDVSQITFNVISIAMEGGQSYQFSCVGGTLSSIAGNTAALQFSSMDADTATITVSVTYRNNTYTRTAKVSKFYEAESGTQGLNNTTVFAYQRSATTLTSNPGAVTYSFTARGITNGTLANGWLKTIPTGTDPLYVTVATASSAAVTDDIAANEWSAPVVLVQNGLPGDPGVNNATVYIYQRTSTNVAPALPSATATYTFSPSGITGLNNGWTTTISAASNGSYLWVSTATAANTTPTDSIPASEWATAQLLVQASATGPAGQRGTVQVARAITGGIWNDSEALLALSGAGYGTPIVRDVVTLYNNASGFSQAKYYDGDSWEILAAYFNGGLIVDGTVYTNALAADSVTADKFDGRSIELKDANGNITFRSGLTLAEQTPSSPNLAARISSWTMNGNAFYVTGSGDKNFANGEYLYLPANQSAPLGVSNLLNIPANAVYTVSFDAYVDSGTKAVSVNVYGTGIDSVGAYETLTTAIKRYRFTETMPNNANAPGCKLRVYSGSGAGNIVVSNIKVELGASDTSWNDSVITKQNASTFIQDAALGLALIDRATIVNLSALVAFLGDCQLGIGGALWAGQTAYDTGNGLRLGTNAADDPYFSMRAAGGKFVRIRPATDTFEFNAVSLVSPSITGGINLAPITEIYSNPTGPAIRTVTRTASVSNARGTIRYQWRFAESPDEPGAQITDGANSQTVTLRCLGKSAGTQASGVLYCDVIDDNGMSDSEWCNVYFLY